MHFFRTRFDDQCACLNAFLVLCFELVGAERNGSWQNAGGIFVGQVVRGVLFTTCKNTGGSLASERCACAPCKKRKQKLLRGIELETSHTGLCALTTELSTHTSVATMYSPSLPPPPSAPEQSPKNNAFCKKLN